MTVREYITSKFQPFGIQLSDADFADIALTIDPDAEYTKDNQKDVFTALAVNIIPQWLLRAKSVSENGFSISWDNDALSKWYSWLCNYLGIDDELNELSKITDLTDTW